MSSIKTFFFFFTLTHQWQSYYWQCPKHCCWHSHNHSSHPNHSSRPRSKSYLFQHGYTITIQTNTLKLSFMACSIYLFIMDMIYWCSLMKLSLAPSLTINQNGQVALNLSYTSWICQDHSLFHEIFFSLSLSQTIKLLVTSTLTLCEA